MSKKQAPRKPKTTLFEKVDMFFEKRLRLFLILSLLLTAIFGFYLFQVRISVGGDDSGYIESAKKFMDGIAFPSYHGVFYSIFLSWVMRIFGFKIFVLKLTSYLFILGHLAFFYYTFRGRVRASLLVMAMLLTSVSAEYLYFGSVTYTEAMYLFLQSALFYLLITYYTAIEDKLTLFKEHWWKVLLTGFLIFIISITRNIGLLMLGIVLFFLLTERKFYLSGYTLLVFILFRVPYSFYKSVRWGLKGEDLSTQLDSLLYKNFYNHALGREDFGGMIDRFLENSEFYLSRLLLVGTGIREPGYTDTSVFITILIYILFAIAIYFAIRKSQVMRLVGYYLGIILFTTFVILQQHWGQMRLVVIYIPLIMLFLPYGLVELAKSRKWNWGPVMVLLLLSILFFRQFAFTVDKAKDNNEVLMKNLRGNKYYGFTDDWMNFLKMSEWAAKNVPEGSMVVSRKPSMSFIYGEGRTFYPMYRFPSFPADSAFKNMEEQPGNLLIINERILKGSNPPPAFEYGMKRELSAWISANDSMYSCYHLSDETQEMYKQTLSQMGLEYHTDLDYLRNKIEASGKPGMAIIPDTLLHRLHRGNVDYMIRGNLRLNPAQKTDRVINTVHRYMYFIEQKYYGIFSEVSQIGNDNAEPAHLYQIHWERFGMQREK